MTRVVERSFGIDAWCWVTSDAYKSSGAHLVRRGVGPVIRPEETARATRWQKVLSWHCLTRISMGEALYREDMQGVPYNESGAVVWLDESARQPAILYAMAKGWRCCKVFEKVCTPVTWFGTVDQFDLDWIRKVYGKTNGPRSLVPGYDEAGLTFMVAKLIADNGRPRGELLVIDVLNDYSYRTQIGNKSSFSELARVDLEELTGKLHMGNDTLVVHAHGEGGHINLKSSVLCGLTAEIECCRGEHLVGGCSNPSDGPAKCKRVWDERISVVSLIDVPLRRLVLFSCNGFAIAGELFPSNVSCTMAACEGYIAQLLVNDRPTPVGPYTAMVVAKLLAAGYEPSDVHCVKDDVRRRIDGVTPYVLCGGTRQFSPAMASVTANGNVSVHSGSAHILDISMAPWCGRTVVDSEGLLWPDGLMVGHRFAMCGAADGGGQPRLIDRGSDAEAFRKYLDELVARVPIVDAVVADQEGALEGAGSEWEPKGRLDDLPAAARILKSSLRTASDRLVFSVQRGVWDDRLLEAAQIVRLCVAEWDKRCAFYLANFGLREGIEHSLLRGSQFRPSNSSISCECCASILLERHFVGWGGEGMATTECPNCGPQSLNSILQGPLIAELPEYLFPGMKCRAVLKCPNGKSRVDRDFHTWCALTLKDKGRGTVVARDLQKISGYHSNHHVFLPEDLSPDLHTIRLAAVRALNVSILRLRRIGLGHSR